jgi:hypothetical protein
MRRPQQFRTSRTEDLGGWLRTLWVPGGGMVSSATDFVRFGQILLYSDPTGIHHEL